MNFKTAVALLVGLSLSATACKSHRHAATAETEIRRNSETKTKENAVAGIVREIGENETAEIVELHFLPPNSAGKSHISSVRRIMRQRNTEIHEAANAATERTDSSRQRVLHLSAEKQQKETDSGSAKWIATAAGIILLTFILLKNNGK